MEFKDKLKAAREKKNLTRHALAVKAGVSASQICALEDGKSNPSAVMLHKLSAALEVEISELL